MRFTPEQIDDILIRLKDQSEVTGYIAEELISEIPQRHYEVLKPKWDEFSKNISLCTGSKALVKAERVSRMEHTPSKVDNYLNDAEWRDYVKIYLLWIGPR